LSAGPVHFKYYLKGYKYAIVVSALSALANWKFGIGYITGYTLGRWIDPDWDLMGTNNAEGRLVNELPLLGHLLYGLSSAYGSIFRKHHRSWMTHWPVISTLGRLIFIFFIPFVVGDGYGINFIGFGLVWFWLGLWMGLSQADAIHLYKDIFPSEE